MREIKFRGRSIITGKFHYGYLVISGENYYILERWIKGKGHRKIMIDPKTVGQFTGLEDKKGKESYEGDIIVYRSEEDNKVIEFYKGTFCYKMYEGKYHIFNEKDCEVIGNIYQNKELLK